MSEINYGPAALADLEDIWSYTVQRWGRKQARDYAKMLDDRCRAVLDGTVIPQKADYVRRGYWRLRAGSHYVFIKRREAAIDVVRIVHARMNILKQFADE